MLTKKKLSFGQLNILPEIFIEPLAIWLNFQNPGITRRISFTSEFKRYNGVDLLNGY
jgi:hypothetical protein